MTQKEMQSILEIGTAISSEKDYNRLLEMINRIMELTHADAGTLYLADGDVLRFKIMRNNTMHTYEGGDGKEPNLPPVKLSRENVCAMSYLENRTVCIENVRTSTEYDFSGPVRYDAMTGYHTQSMLVVPMHNRQGERLGVIQLINAMDAAGDVCAFPTDIIPAVESVASQAAITIQNVLYIENIKELFESFVRVMSSAVDERTPYNASHTRHMVESPFREIRLLIQIASLKGEISVETMQECEEELQKAQETILRANTAGFCPDDLREEVCRIHEKTYMEEDGSEKPWLEEEEFQDAHDPQGNLVRRRTGRYGKPCSNYG